MVTQPADITARQCDWMISTNTVQILLEPDTGLDHTCDSVDKPVFVLLQQAIQSHWYKIPMIMMMMMMML